VSELPIPPFYVPAHAADWSYRPDQQALFEAAREWRRTHSLRPAGEDAKRVHLLLVDLQKDFCFPEGSLYVGGRSGRGAIEDNDRIARFLYKNLESITDVTCTMDTHYPHQIFFSSFWQDAEGRAPSPHREVSTDEIRAGVLRPDPDLAAWLADGDVSWLERQVAFYVEELEKAGKYKLYLWPPHCLLGSDGHTLAGVIHEARLFHAWTRTAPSRVEIKGGHALTENYSVLAPEVLRRFDGRPLAERNASLVETLLATDAVIVAGQAASHCVKSTLEDLLGEIRARDLALAGKVYVLTDCMSSVAVPDPEREGEFVFDFTPRAEEAQRCFAEAGMHLVRSTEPMAEWPGSQRT
jgi:nicotinamidase-related amidase